MKALVLKKTDTYPHLREIELKQSQQKVKVKVKAAALNHRDVWICKGMYPGIQYPIILGSDGAGEYDGKKVLINPSHQWGEHEYYQEASYMILGLPENGTFAEYLHVEEKYIHDIPGHLDYTQAAALPLAGLTAYRALFSRARLQGGERVFINGIGGGVALFAFQFALAHGAEVWVSSGSQEKMDRALSEGAKGAVNYRSEDWSKSVVKQCGHGFDVIIDGAGGAGFHHLMRLANPGTRIAVYGGTRGAIPQLNTQQLFWKQISILGSTMGSEKDFAAMLDFVSQYKIVPFIDSIYPLRESKQAFERMDKGAQFGKIVFNLAL
jgi:zinc-binding alcohol dehydrogenase/oxidoreductase